MKYPTIERKLEYLLEKKGMPLGKIITAEDLDYDAEIQDLFTDIKSDDHPIVRFLAKSFGKISQECDVDSGTEV